MSQPVSDPLPSDARPASCARSWSGSDAGRHPPRASAVSRADLARLAPGHYDPERLVAASFAFLLAREPREAILRSFDLPVIERYFPGYEVAIRRQLAA